MEKIRSIVKAIFRFIENPFNEDPKKHNFDPEDKAW